MKKRITAFLLVSLMIFACSMQSSAAGQPLSVYTSYTIPYGTMRMVAHRGYSVAAPENTLPAFVAAGEAGFWGAECDTMQTADGVWVLMHDVTVDRMTNGTGFVSEMTYAELSRLTVDSGSNIDKYPGTKVPTLEEYLDICCVFGLHPVIEINRFSDPEKLVGLAGFLNARREKDMFVIISFGREICAKMKRYLPDIPVYYLAGMSASYDDIDFAVKNHLDGMDILHSLPNDYYKAIRKAGLDIMVWTVDGIKNADRVYEFGVTSITTDKLTQDKPQGNIFQKILWRYRDLFYKMTKE